ncbi:hypothetical protein Ciccas_000902 [Cichlidogyrus casuarinus]|uniref:Uncharacterized protein n=1 Tax=Cichlidogyrus casuarinus TaxID=1844966 RepID=A0ABD2QPK2_9PLAT
MELFANLQPHVLHLLTLSLELRRWLSMNSLPEANVYSVGAENRVRRHFETILSARMRTYASAFTHDWLLKHKPEHWETLPHIKCIASTMTPSKFSESILIAIWRSYMAFEWSCISMRSADKPLTVELARERRTRIKDVFYRAIDQLPWAKVLYTDLVTYCPYDVQEVVNLLTERQLRLRTPLEEVDLLLTAQTL